MKAAHPIYISEAGSFMGKIAGRSDSWGLFTASRCSSNIWLQDLEKHWLEKVLLMCAVTTIVLHGMVAEPGSHPRPHECLQQYRKNTKGNCGQPANVITAQTAVFRGGGRWGCYSYARWWPRRTALVCCNFIAGCCLPEPCWGEWESTVPQAELSTLAAAREVCDPHGSWEVSGTCFCGVTVSGERWDTSDQTALSLCCINTKVLVGSLLHQEVLWHWPRHWRVWRYRDQPADFSLDLHKDLGHVHGEGAGFDVSGEWWSWYFVYKKNLRQLLLTCSSHDIYSPLTVPLLDFQL